MTNRIVLYDYWRSSSSYRVRIGLNLLGLSYECRPVDLLKGEQAEAEHLSRNPQGLVPALEIDGHLLTQSLAILEYLEETRQAGLLPREALGRQRVRTIAYAIAMEIQPVCNLRVAKHAAVPGGPITIESWMQRFIALGLRDLESMLAEGPETRFCHGDKVTLADICLVPQFYNAQRWQVDTSGMPRITAIAENLSRLEPFSAAHPDLAKPST